METYVPGILTNSDNAEDIVAFINQELSRIATALNGVLPQELTVLYKAPDRLRDFMVVAADGTYWNPGSGQGVYCYYASAWHFLG